MPIALINTSQGLEPKSFQFRFLKNNVVGFQFRFRYFNFKTKIDSFGFFIFWFRPLKQVVNFRKNIVYFYTFYSIFNFLNILNFSPVFLLIYFCSTHRLVAGDRRGPRTGSGAELAAGQRRRETGVRRHQRGWRQRDG